MNSEQHTTTRVLGDTSANALRSRPAHIYTHDQLADLYNQTRIDYIVPMPMDGKRMADYIQQYDVSLDASRIAFDANQQPIGVIMLGLRGDRSWITRLGVLPNQRGNKVGQYLMERSIEVSKQLHVRTVQLEVIQGNQPAYQLFRKLGFLEIGELMVIRRPPSPLVTSCVPERTLVETLDAEAIHHYLAQRNTQVAWTEEPSSLLHAGTLRGIRATLPNQEFGWVVYQLLPLQLTHIVLSPSISDEMAQVLLHLLHKQHPFHDTKVENVPFGHPIWTAFQQLGYLESFRRIEMRLSL